MGPRDRHVALGWVGLWSLGLLCPGRLPAQSLGEAAAKEKQRRTQVEEKARRYSDEDLEARADEGETHGDERASATSAPAPAPSSVPSVVPAMAPAWRARAARHRQRVEKAEARVVQAQQRARSLVIDSGPAPTEHVSPLRSVEHEQRRKDALRELEEAEQELKEARQAQAEFEEEARRKSIPRGWIDGR